MDSGGANSLGDAAIEGVRPFPAAGRAGEGAALPTNPSPPFWYVKPRISPEPSKPGSTFSVRCLRSCDTIACPTLSFTPTTSIRICRSNGVALA